LELDLDTDLAPLWPLEPSPSDTTIAAIDVSSARLGSARDGEICALRGAIAYLRGGKYECWRIGPFLLKMPCAIEGGWNSEIVSEQLVAKARNRLERWLQRYVCATVADTIALFDGSLTAGTPDNPARGLGEILALARANDNTVIGISKRTRLKLKGRRATEFLDGRIGPVLLDIDHLIRASFPPHPVDLLGHVYLGKLAPDGMAFRIDVDDSISSQAGLSALRSLIGNEVLYQGYPETLRIAHMHSAFTASEAIAAQAYAEKRYGLRIERELNYRRSLFGPFGT